MSRASKEHVVTRKGSRPSGAEQQLKELGITLPAPPSPFGAYVEAVQTGNLLFLSGMLPTEDCEAKVIGRLGAERDVEAARKAAHLAALNVLAVARQHPGSLDRVTRVVRLGVSIATSGDVRDQPSMASPACARHAGRTGNDFRGGEVSVCRAMLARPASAVPLKNG